MALYHKIDRSGTTLAAISGVLDPVALTGVITTSGSNLITVDSTTGVYPGMALKGPAIPLGAFVHCVRSTTVLELYATVWTVATGVGSTSAANANASASLSAQKAYALGFDATTPVSLWYVLGKWRNQFTTEAALPSFGTLSAGVSAFNSTYPTEVKMPGLVTVLTSVSGVSAGTTTVTPTLTIMSDEAVATPLKRDNGEGWTHYILVSTGGHQSRVSIDPTEHDIVYAGADA